MRSHFNLFCCNTAKFFVLLLFLIFTFSRFLFISHELFQHSCFLLLSDGLISHHIYTIVEHSSCSSWWVSLAIGNDTHFNLSYKPLSINKLLTKNFLKASNGIKCPTKNKKNGVIVQMNSNTNVNISKENIWPVNCEIIGCTLCFCFVVNLKCLCFSK